jgi:murein L,D-transpeptidase YcbB/YkuD
MVVNGSDSVIDPHSIDWSKLDSKHFPYLIRQREGDDNSLGVIKFNFANKYAVYLHDTNARSLFSRSARALSHGCVRVQKWQELSQFLVRSDTTRFPTDTLNAWIERQEKHTVTGFPRVPLYIRYFTVEGKNGRLNFYSDIYGYDRIDRNKYFATRSI